MGGKLNVFDPSSDRGQLYTMEAFLGLLTIASVIMVIGSGLTIPLFTEAPEETRNGQTIEEVFDTVLSESKADGSLQSAILQWDRGEGSFVDDDLTPTTQRGYFVTLPSHTFSQRLQVLKHEYNVSMNIQLVTAETGNDASGGGQAQSERQYYVREGVSSGETIEVSTRVTLFETDRLRSSPAAHDHEIQPIEQTAGDGDRLGSVPDGEYPISQRPNTVPDSTVYNTVIVEVVIWHD